MCLYDDLKTIEASDPDGGERQPTEADYKAHETWARQTFGAATWETYKRGGWGREPDSTEAAMLRVYEGAWRKAYNAPDAKRGAGHRAGLAAVVAMPEVRDAIADEMENCAHEWRDAGNLVLRCARCKKREI